MRYNLMADRIEDNNKIISDISDTSKDFEKFYSLFDKLEAAGQSNNDYRQLLENIKKFQKQGLKVRAVVKNKKSSKTICRELEQYHILRLQITLICNNIARKNELE